MMLERLLSEDWRDTVQPNIFGVMVIKRKPGIMKLFNQEKNLSLLYRKGEGNNWVLRCLLVLWS